MKLFAKETQAHEALPDQITSNELIECWHSNADGALAFLAVDGSAKSAESEERFWRRVVFAFVGCGLGGIALNNILLGSAFSDKVGVLSFWATMAVFVALVILFGRSRKEKRICAVTTTELFIEREDGTQHYALNQVVGLQRHAIDKQKLDKERRRFRKHRDPKLKQPFSAELMLETVLGQVSLGAVFGLEEARNIADAMNTAIQFMKGRTGTGAGTVVDPRFQYKGKSAGQIPD